jgi:hypothetical protein
MLLYLGFGVGEMLFAAHPVFWEVVESFLPAGGAKAVSPLAVIFFLQMCKQFIRIRPG